VNDFAPPNTPVRVVAFVPERIFPTAPKPGPQKKRLKLRHRLRQWPELRRRRMADRREESLGADGRIHTRWDDGRMHGARVAVYAHYASTGRVSAMVLGQLAAYAAQSYEIVFVSMAAALAEGALAELKKLCRAVVVRSSFGRDFGAWRDTLSLDLVRQEQIQELLLVNDSVLGPIRPLDPLFERMRCAEGLWGLVNSDQNGAHLQTFLLLAKGRTAVDATFDFFRKLVLSTDKEIVIENGELAFTSAIARRGVPVWALYGLRSVENTALADARTRLETVLTLGNREIYEYVCRHPDASPEDLNVRIRNVMAATPLNPTHQFGEVMVRAFDFPFIKTELLNVNPANMAIASTWRELVTEESPCSVDMIVEHLCLV
jgi:lipopolysaccharide biosynthesis protein